MRSYSLPEAAQKAPRAVDGIGKRQHIGQKAGDAQNLEGQLIPSDYFVGGQPQLHAPALYLRAVKMILA